jgi:hypothetical protein
MIERMVAGRHDMKTRVTEVQEEGKETAAPIAEQQRETYRVNMTPAVCHMNNQN